MGTLNIAVNPIGSSGYAHAFVEVVTGGPHSGVSSITQVHGEAWGGAVFGGGLSATTDLIPIHVEYRIPNTNTTERVSSFTVASGVPDRVLLTLLDEVKQDAVAHFYNAQYESPELATSKTGPTGLGMSVSHGGISYTIMPDVATFKFGVPLDDKYWHVQNSNTVAHWIAAEMLKRLADLGYDVGPLPSHAKLGRGLDLPGWLNDASDLKLIFFHELLRGD
jgi:hypothetical protein